MFEQHCSPQEQQIKAAVEFAVDDIDGLKAWIEEHAEEGPGWIAGYCGFQPIGSMLIREDLVVRDPPPKLDAIAPLVDRRARNHPEEGWSIESSMRSPGNHSIKPPARARLW